MQKGKTEYWGASLGAISAVGHCFSETQVHIADHMLEHLLGSAHTPHTTNIASSRRSYIDRVHGDWMGLWGCCGEFFRDMLQEALPEDISYINGRVHVSITVISLVP